MLFESLLNGTGGHVKDEDGSIGGADRGVLAAAAEGRSSPVAANVEFIVPADKETVAIKKV